MQLVAREGDAAPGGSVFATFDAIWLSQSNAIVEATMAENAGSHVTSANNVAIFEGTQENNLIGLVRTGDVVNGKTIAVLTLTGTSTIADGQTRAFASATGDLAVLASFTDKSTGIVTSFGGTEALPYKEGDTAPGLMDATFAKFGSPIVNDHDHIAFDATMTVVTGNLTSATSSAVWADDSNGKLGLIAQTGVSTSLASGDSVTLLSFSDPLYNNNENTVFAATYKTGSVLHTGIFRYAGGSLSLVAQTGSAAPGCASGVSFSSFTSIALSDLGGVAFEGKLSGSGVTGATNTGVWSTDQNGELQLVVRTGDELLPGKEITAIAFLPFSTALSVQTLSIAPSSGDLVFMATFSDKSQGIFHVQSP